MPYADPDAQRAYQNAWMQRRRREWIDANGPCVDCGSEEHLEVDHRDATQKVTHRVWSWSEPRRLAELAKCVVRCHDCHVAKTTTAQEKPRGRGVGAAKLYEHDVVEIRRLVAAGRSAKGVARQFGVDNKTVRLIVARETWAHVA